MSPMEECEHHIGRGRLRLRVPELPLAYLRYNSQNYSEPTALPLWVSTIQTKFQEARLRVNCCKRTTSGAEAEG
jgi:hypothetical protein